VLGLVMALLVAGDLPVVHDHAAPGFYNEDCPLARLATTSPRVSVSSSDGSFRLARAGSEAPIALGEVLASFDPASSAPRAPPSTDPLPSRAVTV